LRRERDLLFGPLSGNANGPGGPAMPRSFSACFSILLLTLVPPSSALEAYPIFSLLLVLNFSRSSRIVIKLPLGLHSAWLETRISFFRFRGTSIRMLRTPRSIVSLLPSGIQLSLSCASLRKQLLFSIRLAPTSLWLWTPQPKLLEVQISRTPSSTHSRLLTARPIG